MKLSNLDRRVLRQIRRQYPIAHDPQSKAIIAVGERPLPTENDIAKSVQCTAEALRTSLSILLSYQCIAKVYLYSRSEFAEQTAGGDIIRLPFLCERAGENAYQVTSLGEATIKTFFKERASQQIATVFSKYAGIGVGVLIGMAATSAYNFMVSRMTQPISTAQDGVSEGKNSEDKGKDSQSPLPASQ